MADRKILCEVVSPERVVYSGEADMVVVRGVEGELGIMPGHIPVITPLKIGELRIKHETGQEYVAVMGGYIEFSYDKATILGDVCELCSEIDVERARQKKEEREREIAEAKLDVEAMAIAEASLAKSLLRLRVAERARQ